MNAFHLDPLKWQITKIKAKINLSHWHLYFFLLYQKINAKCSKIISRILGAENNDW
jgi:hypothetical protein